MFNITWFDKWNKSMSFECENGHESGSSCLFTCPEPYRVNGTDQVTCSDGQWDLSPPSCCMGESYTMTHRR